MPIATIAKWNGPNGSYENLADFTGYAGNGDVLLATASGTNPTIITMYKNGTQIMRVSDTNSGGIRPVYVRKSGDWFLYGMRRRGAILGSRPSRRRTGREPLQSQQRRPARQ